jgi:hypothetical protein
MNATLLKKVEELTLYVIELNSKISALKKEKEMNASKPGNNEIATVDLNKLNARLIALETQLAKISLKSEKNKSA